MKESSEATRGPGATDPDCLGKYKVVRRLGQGAMGVVYHARDPLLDRNVALKVMLPQVASDPEQKLRFEREARAVARLMHTNVVTVFDLGYHTDGSPYIAMEFLRGRDLQRVLREGPPLPLAERLGVVLQVLDGLGHAHAAGIVHRDIKPANVFLTDEGNVKIMDFGVARFTMSSTTSSGVVVGTADYMSPEQVAGDRVDGRSDLFSAGSMLYELLTGRRPFHGETFVSILYKIAHEEPDVSLPEGAEYAPLAPVLRKALAKDAESRYQTAAEFSASLKACLVALAPGAVSAEVQGADGPASDTGDRPGPGTTVNLGVSAPVARAPVGLPRAPAAAVPVVAPAPPAAPPPDPLAIFALLRAIDAGGKSGHLHFSDGRARRSLRFSYGQVIYATSDAIGEHLGDVLVRYGRLAQADLDGSVRIALNARRRLGRILLEKGLLDEMQLREAVGLHAREILFDATSRPGTFAFEESGPDTVSGEGVASQLSTLELILEAARRVQDPGVVAGAVGDLERVLVVADDALTGFQHIQLTPADGFLLSRIDGQLAAREVFQLIPLPTENVERSLFSLLATGAVEYRAPGYRQARPARPVREPDSRPPHPTGSSQAGRDLEDEKRRREDAERQIEATRRAIVEAHEGLRSKNHYELLGVPREATAAQLQEAHHRMAAMFDPEGPLHPSLADLRPLREAVFIRVGQAFETLCHPGLRLQYETTLRRVPTSTAPPPPAVVRPAEERPPEENEAHAAWVAREHLAEAEARFQEGLYWEAIQAAERSLPLLEGADRLKARILIARAQMRNPNWTRRAEEALQAILHEQPRAVDVCLALGQLYREKGLPARALAMYRRVLEVDPQNKEALGSLHEMGADPQSAEAASRLRRLFGKD